MPPKKRYRRVIVWMRRALRTRDNTALWHAVRDADQVIPLVCIHGEPADKTEMPRRIFVKGALADLDAGLRRAGSRLFVRVGNPFEEIPAAAEGHNAEAVYAPAVYDPRALKRDRQIAASLKMRGRELLTFKDAVIFDGAEILNAQGLPYKVFTPYRKAWLSRIGDVNPVLPPLGPIRSPGPTRGDFSLERVPGFENLGGGGGETSGLKRAKTFFASGLENYSTTRNLPGVDGTSRLSSHLAHGTLSIRMVFLNAMKRRTGASRSARESIDVFLSELIWREFYYQILYHFPHVIDGAFRTEFDSIPWSQATSHFSAWAEGRTGFPIVDAGMRQLNSEGWMHNRVRMIVASFLTKDLHISWRRGERYFFERLLDADWASNNGGWQWAAGTGTDASPWFRIFNPVLQGEKFDPRGEYVRRYLPELALIPDRFIHRPWEMTGDRQRAAGCVVGVDYPAPIVDHGKERLVTLELYGRARRGPAARLVRGGGQR